MRPGSDACNEDLRLNAFVLGALLMASPIVLLKIKNLRYFRQDR